MRAVYRMRYNPETCIRHYKGYTTKELAYMCFWYGVVSSREIALVLGRTQDSVLSKVKKLKHDNEFEAYKTMYANM